MHIKRNESIHFFFNDIQNYNINLYASINVRVIDYNER